MPSRPKPQRRAKTPARLLSEVAADNIRAYRTLRRMSQDTVAARMVALGHTQWSRAAVSEVERHGRQLVLDELLALAVVLEKSLPQLLDPAGPGGEGRPLDVDYGGPEPMPRWAASDIAQGNVERWHVEWSEDGPPRVSLEGVDPEAQMRAMVEDALARIDQKKGKRR